MKKFHVEKIFVFGESIRFAAESDLDLIVANPTNEYHVLRHYPRLPESYSNMLVGEKYEYFDYRQRKFLSSIISRKDIEIAYQTKGTKFYPRVSGIENPRALIGFIKAGLQKLISAKSMTWIQKPQYDTLMLTMMYHEFVGNQDLVPIHTLPRKLRSKVQTISRGNHEGERSIMIKTITDVPKIPTRCISVEINLMPRQPRAFLTAYPGALAPGFPTPNQYREEYQYNKAFWDTHVFLV